MKYAADQSRGTFRFTLQAEHQCGLRGSLDPQTVPVTIEIVAARNRKPTINKVRRIIPWSGPLRFRYDQEWPDLHVKPQVGAVNRLLRESVPIRKPSLSSCIADTKRSVFCARRCHLGLRLSSRAIVRQRRYRCCALLISTQCGMHLVRSRSSHRQRRDYGHPFRPTVPTTIPGAPLPQDIWGPSLCDGVEEAQALPKRHFPRQY